MNAVRLSSQTATCGARPFGAVTRKMLHERTCEIARRAGRTAPYVIQDDYEQAKLELTGDRYALIMDTSIDEGVLPPCVSPAELSQPNEAHQGPTPHARGGSPTPLVFWGGARPLAGASC
jgi:hypothetical protein